MKHTRKILTSVSRHLPYLFAAEIVNLTVYLSSDVRVVNYFIGIEKNVANVAKKEGDTNFSLFQSLQENQCSENTSMRQPFV